MIQEEGISSKKGRRSMKNDKIAKMLKERRKLSKLSVNEVSDLLCEHHAPVAAKTIYGWESGHTQPDADTLLFLCRLYNIDDILKTFGYGSDENEAPKPILTEFEYKLIEKYREHPDMHDAVHKLLEINSEND